MIGINQEHEVTLYDCVYYFAGQHRQSATEYKSEWTITLSQELACFTLAKDEGWTDNSTGWSLHLIRNAKASQLGRNVHNERLYIAKFRDSLTAGTWHGYPADYARNIQDRPSTEVLLSWNTKGYILKHHIAKIRAGKRCTL